MNHLARALQLMVTPRDAAVIQVAALIRQALHAHAVAVIKKNVSDTAKPPEIVWSDGLSDTGGDTEGMDGFEAYLEGEGRFDQQLLCGIVQSLFATDLDLMVQQTRFLPENKISLPQEGEGGQGQAVCWRVPRRGEALGFIWLRRAQAPFMPHDRSLFRELQPIASKLLSQQERLLQAGPPDQHNATIPQTQKESNWGALSPMERTVLEYLQRGVSESEIAQDLNRSRHTIHVHVKGLYRKFLVHSRGDLLEAAQKRCRGEAANHH